MSLADSLTKRVQELEADRDEWREKCHALEFMFQSKCITPMAWGLTAQQARIFAVLLSNHIATHDQILTAMNYGGKNTVARETSLNTQMHHLREKLRPFSITITSVFGVGYSMNGAVKSPIPSDTPSALNDPRFGFNRYGVRP